MVILGIVFNNMVVDMKANEFIKKYGIDEAKVFVNNVIDHLSMGADFDVEELKRLIESHDLVNKVGGLKKAKTRAENKFKPVGKNLIQSITDVESCQ